VGEPSAARDITTRGALFAFDAMMTGDEPRAVAAVRAIGAKTRTYTIVAARQVIALAAKRAARARRTPVTLDARFVLGGRSRSDQLLETPVELGDVGKLHETPFTPFGRDANRIGRGGPHTHLCR